MRALLFIASARICRQPRAGPDGPRRRPRRSQLPPELTDPAMADRLGEMVRRCRRRSSTCQWARSKRRSKAARPPRPTADRPPDVGRKRDPKSERDLDREIEASRPAMQAGMRAFAAALPAMMQGLSEAQPSNRAGYRQHARPDYPKR